MVKAPVCGTGDRGFESHLPPHFRGHTDIRVPSFLRILREAAGFSGRRISSFILGCSLVVGQQTLTLPVLVRFQPSQPAQQKNREPIWAPCSCNSRTAGFSFVQTSVPRLSRIFFIAFTKGKPHDRGFSFGWDRKRSEPKRQYKGGKMQIKRDKAMGCVAAERPKPFQRALPQAEPRNFQPSQPS